MAFKYDEESYKNILHCMHVIANGFVPLSLVSGNPEWMRLCFRLSDKGIKYVSRSPPQMHNRGDLST